MINVHKWLTRWLTRDNNSDSNKNELRKRSLAKTTFLIFYCITQVYQKINYDIWCIQELFKMSVGESVRGWKCPGWKCPWAEVSWVEMSVGGTVRGWKCPGWKCPGWKCPWVEVSWVEMSVGGTVRGGSVRVEVSGVEVSGHQNHIVHTHLSLYKWYPQSHCPKNSLKT